MILNICETWKRKLIIFEKILRNVDKSSRLKKFWINQV